VKNVNNLISATDAKGIEKVVLIVNTTVTKLELSLVTIFEGKPLQPGKKHKNPLDYGLIPVVRDLSQIDLCNVLNYTISKIPNLAKNIPPSANRNDGSSNLADSTKKEARQKSPLEKAIYFVQDKSYEAQKLIDNYYALYGTTNDLTSRTALLALCRNLQITLQSVNQSDLVANQDVVKVFPQLKAYNSFIENAFGYFNRFLDASLISNSEVEKVTSFVDKIRNILVAIQLFDIKNPAQLLSLGLSYLPQKVQQDIDNLNKLVKPEKLLPFLKSVQSACINIQTQANFLMTAIKSAQTFISTLVSVVRLFKIIKDFVILILSALPNMFTTVGLNIILQESSTRIDKLIENIVKRLDQLNVILLRCVTIVEYIVSKIEEILFYLRIIIANLENCTKADPQIVKDLKDTAESLQNVSRSLNDFKNNYENKKSSSDSTFGDRRNKYTIKIVTEEVTDEGITLKRRYGIALDNYGALVASSTPTFASEDSIIIDEVKLILVSKKLVNPEISTLSTESVAIINESLNFLEEDDINTSQDLLDFNTNFTLSGDDLDDPNNENEELGIGLNAFLNKLPGGKKLRNRVRSRILKRSDELSTRLASENSPLAQKVASEQSTYAKNMKIQDLQQKRAELVKQREEALKKGFAGQQIVSQKTKEIKDIDAQIAELRK
jgi:hypothetical protein